MQVLKEEVKSRILTAAEKVFYEQDYRSAKLTNIAEQADIFVALIYTYFKNKEGLFDEVGFLSWFWLGSPAFTYRSVYNRDMKNTNSRETILNCALEQIGRAHV